MIYTKMKKKLRHGILAVSVGLMMSQLSFGAQFTANFQDTDIQEFINTVSKNLNKTVIIDPSVKGNVTVRSYDELNEEQYYAFFLSVLEVYGFAVVEQENGVLKVVRSKNAKEAAVPVVDDASVLSNDEVVTKVVPLKNVNAKDLAPLLRQLNDTAGAGNVVHYEPSNVLLLTGRVGIINRLLEIINRVDKAGDQTVDTIALQHASAEDVVKMVNDLLKSPDQASQSTTGIGSVRIVADTRTNSVLIIGEEQARTRIRQTIEDLDRERVTEGSTKVIYLKFANAENLVDVLTGFSTKLESEQATSGATSPQSIAKNTVIKADPQTNSLIINANPDIMRELENVISQLDVRRPQVLVEAIIVEVQNAEGLNLGIQWANTQAGFTQFTNSGIPITTALAGARQYENDGTLDSAIASTIGGFNGIAAGFYSGNWSALLTALSSDTQNNILATPSIVTLDNKEALINVGQEVPVLSGSQTTSGDNIFNTVDRKNVGIKLKVKPQVNEGGSVILEIEQEVSSVADTPAQGSAELGATFNTRTITNALLVNSGEAVVVGGLLDESTKDTQSKVPLLGDIPVVGNLFKSTSTGSNKRNLMLFIRPTIIQDQDSFGELSARKYGEFQRDRSVEAANDTYNQMKTPAFSIPDLEKKYIYEDVKNHIQAFNQ